MSNSSRTHLLSTKTITDNEILDFLEGKWIPFDLSVTLKEIPYNESSMYVTAATLKNDRYTLTMCLYCNDYYVGVYDNINHCIHFDIMDDCLHGVNLYAWRKLLMRVVNVALNPNSHSYSKDIESAWYDCLPLIQVTSLYKRYINEYEPLTKYSAEYDNVLNKLVDTYYELRDNGLSMEGMYLIQDNTIPSLTKAMELYDIETQDPGDIGDT